MNKDIKKFILGITLFLSGLISSGLNLISNSIVLQTKGNNLIPFTMFIVTLAVAVVGFVLMIKNLKK
jgi:ABC-type uncharacterized transport system fused permease/ATPase subunit